MGEDVRGSLCQVWQVEGNAGLYSKCSENLKGVCFYVYFTKLSLAAVWRQRYRKAGVEAGGQGSDDGGMDWGGQ